MTFPEFDKFFDTLIEECRGMRDTKGKEYAHSESRFANFDRAAERLGISRTMAASVYLYKHLDAIDSYIKTGTVHSEAIRGRIVDAITYLTLIAGMIDEEADTTSQPDVKGSEYEDLNLKAIGGNFCCEYDRDSGYSCTRSKMVPHSLHIATSNDGLTVYHMWHDIALKDL